MNKFLSLDSIYTIDCETQLNSFDRKIMTALYQPIIGFGATSLYLALWSEVDIDHVYSTSSYFKRLSKIMNMDLLSIVDNFNVLEALGLVITYYKKEKDKQFYQIKVMSPDSPQTFFKNPLLVNHLKRSLGKEDYIKTKMFFQKSDKKMEGYQDISKKYQDVFSLNADVQAIVPNETYKNYSYAKIKGDVDFSVIKEALRPFNLHYLLLDKKVCDTIEMLLLSYSIASNDLVDSMVECAQNNAIDLEELVKNIELKDTIRQYKTSLDLVYLKNSQADNKYEKNSVFDFMKKYYKSLKVDNDLLLKLEKIMRDYQLTTGVCNVLIELSVDSNGFINPNYIRVVAKQWQETEITTLDKAQQQVIKINNSKNKSKNKKQGKITIGSTHDWYQVDEELENQVSDEELAQVKEMFK